MKIRYSGAAKARVGLSAACVALTSLIAWQLSSSPIRHESAAVGAAADSRLPPLPSATFNLAPLEVYSAAVDRPLFDQTRRPAEPAAETLVRAEPAPRRPPPEWTLIGTVIKPATGAALLWDPATRQFLQLERGMSHDGWQVVEVTRGSVVLESGSMRHELTMAADPERSFR